MKTKNFISANKAIQEAIKLGFRTRFTHHQKRIQSAVTGKDYSEKEFAVVRSYPVNLVNGHSGVMEYIVLNSGKLGFILDEIKEKAGTEEERQEQQEPILENIYSF